MFKAKIVALVVISVFLSANKGCTLYPVFVPQSGQTNTFATGDDGDLEKGVPWPNPRFTDNLDGTITDNLTRLIWLEDANCFGTSTWNDALSECNGLAAGQCGVTDGSSAGDWRVPHVKELQSLIDYAYMDPALPNTAGTGQWSEGDLFNNVQLWNYWSSTTWVGNTANALHASIKDGGLNSLAKSNDSSHVWCVRGGY